MLDAAGIHTALQRARTQYGPNNVDLNMPFLKLLAFKTFQGNEGGAHQAFIAPLDEESLKVGMDNVQWAHPDQNGSCQTQLKKLKALNAARKELGLAAVTFDIRARKFQQGIVRKRAIALQVAKFFFAQRTVIESARCSKKMLPPKKQTQSKDIYDRAALHKHFNMIILA